MKVDLKEGAEGSSVKVTDSTANVEVKNDTTDKVTVTTPSGEQTVDKGTESNTGKTEDETDKKEEDKKEEETTPDYLIFSLPVDDLVGVGRFEDYVDGEENR